MLIVRNPYAAILSDHNFIYAGHHGSAPLRNFERKGNLCTNEFGIWDQPSMTSAEWMEGVKM